MPSTAGAIDLPFEEAIAFFRQKTSVKTQAWTDVYAAAHSKSFMVAGAASDALVSDFEAEIDKALAEGTTIADFRDRFDEIVAKHGWEYKGKRGWRTRIIFDTNLRTAYAAGRYAQLTAPGTAEAFPFWQYNHSGAKHPRREHLAWDGMVLRSDEPFWSTNYPPNGWHCGCFVIPVSSAGLRRQGKSGPDEAPDLVFRAEEVGGVVRRVPQGVDPGFEYNPGQAWLERTIPGPQGRTAATVAPIAAVRRFFASAERGLRPPEAYVPIATVPADLATAFEVAPGTEVRLSAATILQHVGRHPEATADAYATMVPLALELGLVIERGPQRFSVFVEDAAGVLWLVALKRTALAEIYTVTIHHSRDAQRRSIERRGRVLREGTRRGAESATPRP